MPLVEPVLGAGRTAGTYATILAVSTIITRLMHAAAAQPVLWWLGIGVTAQEKVPAAPSAVTPAAESGPSAPTGA